MIVSCLDPSEFILMNLAHVTKNKNIKEKTKINKLEWTVSPVQVPNPWW